MILLDPIHPVKFCLILVILAILVILFLPYFGVESMLIFGHRLGLGRGHEEGLVKMMGMTVQILKERVKKERALFQRRGAFYTKDWTYQINVKPLQVL